jgi:hypothetical protein
MMPLAPAQVEEYPHGMYCGGNQLIDKGHLEASAVNIVVVDPAGYPLPDRVQVQVVGRDDIILDRQVDEHGRLKVRSLPSGEYWLGISSRGFNFPYWRLSKSRKHPQKVLRVTLSFGT